MTPTPEDIALASSFANGRPWIVQPLAEAVAAQFPAWAFWLVWRKAGQWQQQRILA